MMQRLFEGLLAIAIVLPPAFGQEIIQLRNGTALEAKVTESGTNATLTTAFGTRSCPKSEIATRAPADALAARFKAMAADVPPAFLAGRAALARWAYDRGLYTAAHDELRRVLDSEVDQPVARALLARIAADWLKGPAEAAARGKEHTHFIEDLFEKVAPKDRVSAALAAEWLVLSPREDHILRESLKAMKNERAHLRWLGARVLAEYRNEPTRILPLFKRGLLDDVPAVRQEAVRSLAVTKDPVFVKLFAKNLVHPNAAIRAHAGEAIGGLGLKEGVEPLLAALADTWRPVRNHIAVTTQRAYVKDYDVEVAQGAVIADPIVDIVQEGAILDVAVISVSIERHIYAASLARLTGVSLGDDPDAWAKHLARAAKSEPKSGG